MKDIRDMSPEEFAAAWPARQEAHRQEHIRRARGTLSEADALPEIELVWGHQLFGSGMFSAGWAVLEGQAWSELVPGTDYVDDFSVSRTYRLTPLTPEVLLRVWNYDGIGGGRQLGRNGYVWLRREPA